MIRQRFDPELPQKIVAQFFAQPRQPRERFWTTREIMQRFGVSQYAANAAVADLARRGALERKPSVGTFVATAGAALLKSMSLSAQCHVGVVLPVWAAESEQNAWATELRTALVKECQRRTWQLSLFQEPGQWTDPLFPTRFSGAGCDRLLMVSPSEPGVVALTKLREAGVPMVSIGHGPSAFDLLKIPVVEGDDEEAMRRLVLQLKRDGCRRLLAVGFIDPLLGTDRVRGLVQAFEQFAHEYPSDSFVNCPDADYLVATVTKRLAGRAPVDAIIFQNHPAFLTAWERVAGLAEKLRAGLQAVVINEYYLRRRFPELPLIEATLNPPRLARTALDVLDGCAHSERARPLTLLPYEIVWPTPRKSRG